MHKVLREKFRFHQRFMLICLSFLIFSDMAHAELREGQSFKPIEWDADFSKDRTLEATWLWFPRGIQIVQPDEQELFNDLINGFGLQLGQWIRDQWQGRMSIFLAQTTPKTGGYVWSFLGSDLKHPLVFGNFAQHKFFQHAKPFGFFGLGVSSRWESSRIRYNLIPTFRYDVSEPTVHLGSSLMIQLSDEMMLSLEFRYFESMRKSGNKFPLWGVSLAWGHLEKR